MATTDQVAVETSRPPPLIPRLIAGVFMFLAACAFVFCLAALGGVWLLRGSAAQSIADLAVSVDQRAQQGQTDLDTLSQSLAEVQGIVGLADDRLQAVSGRLDEAGPILTAIANLLNSSLGGSLDDLAQRAASLHDSVAAIDSAVAALSQIPILGQVGGDALAKADDLLNSVQNVTQQVADLRQAVNSPRDSSGRPLPAALTSVTASLTRLQDRLNAVQTRISAEKSGLKSLQANLAETVSKLTTWITYAAAAVSVMLLGTLVAMATVFLQALSFFLGRDILAGWRHR